VNLGDVNYASAIAPPAYECHSCGVHGCKLWREYQTFADRTELVCCDCAGKSQQEDVSSIDADGRRKLGPDYPDDCRTDQIGWRVPAVPTQEGDTFWGYTSVPADGVAWWRRLPTRAATVDARRDGGT
jgi:hypothetical protein